MKTKNYYGLFKEVKQVRSDSWMDASVEPVDVFTNRKQAVNAKRKLESMNNRNEPHLTRFKIQPERI